MNAIVVVHSGAVTVTPRHVDGVFSDGLHIRGTNIRIDRRALNGALARVLVHTGSAGAIVSKFHIRQGKLFTIVKRDKHFGGAEGFNLGGDEIHSSFVSQTRRVLECFSRVR